MAMSPAPQAHPIRTTDFTDFTDGSAMGKSVKSAKSVVQNDSGSAAHSLA